MNSTISKKNANGHSAFAKDILDGLSKEPKQLSSKYFYDAKGDKLFQDIMNMPEYYLTDCEFEIFETQKDQILSLIGDQEFDLIELGAGDGTKTKVLLEYFLEKKAQFNYAPIDISQNVLDLLSDDLCQNMPAVSCQPLQGDYFDVLGRLSQSRQIKKVVLFLGANIGNLKPSESLDFLTKVQKSLSPGDLLIIGFDLKKDPSVILNAYNDSAGITAAFNLNLLSRINKELNADFKVDNFQHWETYNPMTGATKSYLISRKEQTVNLKSIDETIHFKAWEAIDMELSQKFDLEAIEKLARASGFEVIEHLMDSRAFFVDSVWQKA